MHFKADKVKNAQLKQTLHIRELRTWVSGLSTEVEDLIGFYVATGR